MSEQVTESTQNNNEHMNEAATSTALDPAQDNADVVDTALLKNIIEAALLTSQEPLALAELKNLAEAVKGSKLVEDTLNQLAQEYSTRGIELTQVASGWRFRARPEMQVYLNRLNPQKQPRYSRAVMETLAIIAYRQPVTRGDIEDIRGVQVASPILKTLEARNWIEVIGTRDVPGKPELFATTQQLLDDLNLRSLHELPELEEMGSLLEHEAPEKVEPENGEPAQNVAEQGLAQTGLPEPAVPEPPRADSGSADAA
jgi:segregation and condensation protein B